MGDWWFEFFHHCIPNMVDMIKQLNCYQQHAIQLQVHSTSSSTLHLHSLVFCHILVSHGSYYDTLIYVVLFVYIFGYVLLFWYVFVYFILFVSICFYLFLVVFIFFHFAQLPLYALVIKLPVFIEDTSIIYIEMTYIDTIHAIPYHVLLYIHLYKHTHIYIYIDAYIFM